MTLKKNKKEIIIRKKLLGWYKINSRKLPWRTIKNRKLPNPYFILVSEIMLQQTTVNAVIPKFNEFIRIWPSLKSLSNTNESKILKFWSGLGYYVRAKNLLKSVKIIAKNFNYIISKEYSDLIQLPGIGDYTAKAILGIAYNKPVMPVDTNIERIIARINGFDKPIKNIKSQIIEYSHKLISKRKSSDFIQSLMDYGSIICLPNQPNCEKCIIQNCCIAFKKKLTNSIPVKKNKGKFKPKKFTRVYIINNEFNEILVRHRSSTGMLQSMLEIPNDEWVFQKKQLIQDSLIKLITKKLLRLNENLIYSFSHFNLEVDIFFTKIKKTKFNGYKWQSLKKISTSGMPTLMKKIAILYSHSVK